ncbi:protein vein isoform X2 [Drosophila tropicalis]|uniref:protein vein isoform X2 n=1 Tax=Drosophila tropicalis TaxID=46794 RepID=UPI0035AB9898
MYAQHVRKWSLKTTKQLMPLILLIIYVSNMLLVTTTTTVAAAAATATATVESSYYINLQKDNDSILSRLLMPAAVSNSLSNNKLMPATTAAAAATSTSTVFTAGSRSSSSNSNSNSDSSGIYQAAQQQQYQHHQQEQHVPNMLINSQIYKLLTNGNSSSSSSSNMQQLPSSLLASNSGLKLRQSYVIESYEVPDSQRNRRDGQHRHRQRPWLRPHHHHHQQQQQQLHQQLQQQQHHQQQQHQRQQPRRKHQRKHRGRQRAGRYCSARDPAQLAFVAPTVFQGTFTSMSADRRVNFSATMKVLHTYKQQTDLQLPQLVRLQFAMPNTSGGECDIYREKLKPRGLLRSGNDLEQASDISYMMFVQQTNPGNFTILGQPIRVTQSVMDSVKMAVSENYAQNASITSITIKTPSNTTTIDHGQELRIICKVSGQPPPKVTWFKDDKSINRNRHVYQFKHHKRRSELIVRSFNSSSDAGKYECRAKNKASKIIDKRRIMINARPVATRPDLDSAKPCNKVISDYCFHGGTCMLIPSLNELVCICPDNFFGKQCENSVPDSRYFVAIYGQIHTLNNDY